MYDLPMPRPVPINATLYISNILEVSESKQMVSWIIAIAEIINLKKIIYKQITKLFQVTFETTFTFSWFDTRYIPSKEFLDSSADTTTDTTGLATWHNFKISGKTKKVKLTNQELRHHRA